MVSPILPMAIAYDVGGGNPPSITKREVWHDTGIQLLEIEQTIVPADQTIARSQNNQQLSTDQRTLFKALKGMIRF